MRHFGDTSGKDALTDMASAPYILNRVSGAGFDRKEKHTTEGGVLGDRFNRIFLRLPTRGSREYQEAMERFRRVTGD